MNTKLLTHALIIALFNLGMTGFAQDNPWQTNSEVNPWENNDSIPHSKLKNSEESKQILVEEILFVYDEYTKTALKGTNQLNSEMNRHVNKTYKSAPMFWTNFTTGLLLNIFSVPINLISSGLPSKRTDQALVNFEQDNPNLDKRTLKKYHSKLRAKKFLSGLGGTVAGIASGIIILFTIALATF